MTDINYVRWCITQIPCTIAERTIWWFLTGNKEWNVDDATKKYNYIKRS